MWGVSFTEGNRDVACASSGRVSYHVKVNKIERESIMLGEWKNVRMTSATAVST